MRKLWLVATHEFRRNVFKKSFILALLAFPLILTVQIGFGLLFNATGKDYTPIGYVDRAGVFDNPIAVPSEGTSRQVNILPFADEGAARAALDHGELQAYYLIPSTYLQTREIELFYYEEPGANATSQFYHLLLTNLLRNQPPQVQRFVVSGVELSIERPGENRQYLDSGPTFSQVFPLAVALGMGFLLMMSSGYLMEAMVQEKQNRTMEVLVTSLSPAQMVAGKVLGISLISLIQIVTWIAFGYLGIHLARDVLSIEWFQRGVFEWLPILGILGIAIPNYVLFSALLFAIGSTTTEPQEGQSVTATSFLLVMCPIYLAIPMLNAPHSTFSIIMSSLPITSVLSMGIRNMLAEVPGWQYALSISIQTIAAAGTLWLATKSFRLGMLRYGKRLRLVEVLRRATMGARS